MGKRAAARAQSKEVKEKEKEEIKVDLLLGGGASEDEDEQGIRVNAVFARAFEERKRREELSKLERRHAAYGDTVEDDEEEDDDEETEDEDGEELTPELDADIRKTLRLIRKKDPAIYDPSIAFFQQAEEDEEEEEEEGDKKKEKKKKKDAPLYYKDLVRRQAIAGDVASGESDEEEEKEEKEEKDVLTFQEEQAKLRQEFLASVGQDEEQGEEEEDGEDEEEGGLFTVRKKSAGEQAAEDAEFAQFTSKYGSAKKQQQGELDPDAFLEHYLSSEGWKDKSAAVPHYEDIVKDDEEDAEALDQAESFEHAYNFRFEEEGGGVIQTYARKVEDSMRRVDDARKRKREERKARKALERQKKEEELRRLKNLKQAEIQAKLDKVARLMGATNEAQSETQRLEALANDLDADFDPEAYDKKMQAIFDDEYYQEGEGDVDAMEKPSWDDEEDKALFAGLPTDPEEEEEKEEKEKEEEEEEEKEEEGEEDKADEQDEEEEEEGGEQDAEEEEALENMTAEEMRRAKQKYLDELYSLDYEDLIGDLKCRFKYRQVRDNDFGLTVDEIMAADDKELKQLVALKRLAPYVEDEFIVDRKKLKRFRKSLEQERREKEEARQAKAKRRLEKEESEAPADAEGKPKKKRKRGKKKEQQAGGDKAQDKEKEQAAAEEEKDKPAAEGKKKRRGKKSKGKDKSAFAGTGLSTSRLESYKLVKSKS